MANTLHSSEFELCKQSTTNIYSVFANCDVNILENDLSDNTKFYTFFYISLQQYYHHFIENNYLSIILYYVVIKIKIINLV